MDISSVVYKFIKVEKENISDNKIQVSNKFFRFRILLQKKTQMHNLIELFRREKLCKNAQ